MITLYYISESLQISTIEVENIEEKVLIPENLQFIGYREGINFINEPDACIDFTDLERLAIANRLDDLNLFKDSPFRQKNTYLKNMCYVPPVPKPFFSHIDNTTPVTLLEGSEPLSNMQVFFAYVNETHLDVLSYTNPYKSINVLDTNNISINTGHHIISFIRYPSTTLIFHSLVLEYDVVKNKYYYALAFFADQVTSTLTHTYLETTVNEFDKVYIQNGGLSSLLVEQFMGNENYFIGNINNADGSSFFCVQLQKV